MSRSFYPIRHCLGVLTYMETQPLPGHAICNIGDALSVFSGGILQSNIHRVVPPPGIQAEYERWSLVYFTRPGNSQVLRALVEDSPLIAASVQKHPDRNFDTGSTAAEWFARRVKYQRINNRKVSGKKMKRRTLRAVPFADGSETRDQRHGHQAEARNTPLRWREIARR